jgi:hypothetical protein
MVTTSCCIRTGIVYTTLEAPMEKTQGTVVAGRCTMVSFQGLKAGTVESILDIWSSALRSASLSKLAASTGAFSSGRKEGKRERSEEVSIGDVLR